MDGLKLGITCCLVYLAFKLFDFFLDILFCSVCVRSCGREPVCVGKGRGGVKWGERKHIKFLLFSKEPPPAFRDCTNFYLILTEPGIKAAPGCRCRISAVETLAWRCRVLGALHSAPVPHLCSISFSLTPPPPRPSYRGLLSLSWRSPCGARAMRSVRPAPPSWKMLNHWTVGHGKI